MQIESYLTTRETFQCKLRLFLEFFGLFAARRKTRRSAKAWEQAYGLGNLTAKYNLILILGKRGNKKLIYAEELRKLADKEEFYLANYETGNIFRKKIKFTEEKIAEEVFNFEKDHLIESI